MAEPAAFERFVEDASVYWRGHLRDARDAGSAIYVEALHHDVRVSLRNLTIANALRRLHPARLVVLTGSDARWRRSFDAPFDVALVEQLARAYGADEVVDIHALADRRAAATGSTGTRTGATRTGDGRPADIGGLPADLAHCVDATYCRLELVPRVTPEARTGAAYADCVARVTALAGIFDELFAGTTPVALITSHVDYDQWGLAVRAARRAAVPVIHTQSTGSLKAYTIFPEANGAGSGLRAQLTTQLGDFFADRVWGSRDRYRDAAERVAWRARGNLGRPSWWRGGGTATVDLANPVERRQVRRHAAARLGLDPDRPTVTVFNHAVSDALGTNREAFTDLAEWFEQTAAYAHSERGVNWLLIDHPSQMRYDSTGFFDSVAAHYAGASHMVFRPSARLSKNVLWSLTDLGLTVRGSVSNEMPAYGIPVVQAGWSEWSGCGLSLVAEDPATYWRTLDSTLADLAAGRSVITDDQVLRARLWLWLYRAGGDVVTGLVPTWDLWPAGNLLHAVRIHMRQVEPDGEPAFAAVERMWRHREPLLTRAPMPAPAAGGASTPAPAQATADSTMLARD